MIKHKSAVRHIPVLLLAATLTGCASTPTVKYESSAPQQPKRPAAVHVVDFVDMRAPGEKGVIGGVYNGYNVRMGDVTEPADLLPSIQNVLTQELKRNGYELAQDANDLELSSKLIYVTCDLRTSSKATIRVEVLLKDKGEEVFTRTYSAEGSSFQLIGQDGGKALADAGKKLSAQIIGDINEYLTT